LEGFFWILFFVVIAILKGLAWFSEHLKGPQNRRQQPPPPRSSGGRRPPVGETPFQAMLRMLEEASGQEPQRQQRRSVPVARAVDPRERFPIEDHGGDLDEHHLRSRIGDRRLRSAIADRHAPRFVHQTHVGALGHLAAPKALTTEERLAALSPLRRAVIMAEVLGEPRYKRRGPPYSSRY
jgi:hypothetical protein